MIRGKSNMNLHHVILASNSPRRRELLEQVGIPFQMIPATGEEITHKKVPAEIVAELSLQKASEVAALPDIKGSSSIVIGADTIVALDNHIMGKPKDEEDAFQMLKSLQGKTHQVFTGVTLIHTKKEPQILTFADSTEVTMYPMTDSEILSYIATGEPMDKAGAYAVQGKCAAFIQSIHGDYNTVVGLPVSRVYQALKEF